MKVLKKSFSSQDQVDTHQFQKSQSTMFFSFQWCSFIMEFKRDTTNPKVYSKWTMWMFCSTRTIFLDKYSFPRCCEGSILNPGKFQSLLQDLYLLTHILRFLPVMARKEKTSAVGSASWWRRGGGQSVKGCGYSTFKCYPLHHFLLTLLKFEKFWEIQSCNPWNRHVLPCAGKICLKITFVHFLKK